jgi:hypothetical protein
LYRIVESWQGTLLDLERHFVMVSDARLAARNAKRNRVSATGKNS